MATRWWKRVFVGGSLIVLMTLSGGLFQPAVAVATTHAAQTAGVCPGTTLWCTISR
jgi:hypothetical protein